MTEGDRRPEINISAIPVAGIGGLGLVAMALVVAWVLPGGRWFLGFSAAGGVLLGLAIVIVRRVFRTAGPSGDQPSILFQTESPAESASSRNRATPPHDLEQLVAVR